MFWDKTNWCRGALRAPAGGHTGPPLRKNRSVIRHCEEGRRPDVAIRAPVQENGFPRPLRGLGMTGRAHTVRLRAATRGRPYKNTESVMWNQRRGQAPALRGYIIRERRAEVVAPYMIAFFSLPLVPRPSSSSPGGVHPIGGPKREPNGNPAQAISIGRGRVAEGANLALSGETSDLELTRTRLVGVG